MFTSRLSIFVFLFPAALAGVLAPAGHAGILSAQEQALATLLVSNGGQQRSGMVLNPILSQVARARAADMATRKYFSHVNPDGVAANYLVKAAGYVLPEWWSTDVKLNYIESISAGYSSASATWSGWMASSAHKRHLLGETDFYLEQTCYGVGYAYSSSSPYKYYWVVITAPPMPAPLTPVELWRKQYFGSPTNESLGADTADGDGDGITNLVEWALAGTPTVPDRQILPVLGVGGNQLKLTFRRNLAATDLTFHIEASSDWGSGNWQVIATKVGTAPWSAGSGVSVNDDGSGLVSVTDGPDVSNSAMRFLRLRVTRP